MSNDALSSGLGLNEPLNGYTVPVAAGVGSDVLGPTEASGGLPAGFSGQAYSQDLLDKAKQQYGFIAKQNPVVQVGQGEGYAETWPTYETGSAEQPRPLSMAPGRVGVEVFNPQQFGPADLAGEMLHVDPYSQIVRNYIQKTLSPEQLQAIKDASGDYEMSIRLGLPEERAVQNALDSAIRGYAVGQWPQDVNASIGYTPEQKQALDNLVTYMKQGKL
jgi:hypothetical protein